MGSAALYGLQAWGHSSGQASVHDEGVYLFNGLLYAGGRYAPFQDFGPWTNHMPLSFLIPGWVQLATEPGLRTGRLYALALAAIFLLAVWILARRLGGRWMGAAVLFALAVNPFLIKIYSQAITQVLVAALLAWALVFALGPERRTWQVLLGTALGGAIVMTRVNMLPVLPLLLLYIFSQYDRRTGWAATAVGLGVVLVGHAAFWPGILKIWAYWLPEAVTPFLDPWRELSGAQLYWNPEINFAGRAESFIFGFHRHLFPWTGITVAAVCWPKRSPETLAERRTAGLLLSLFFTLLIVHAWAALGHNYCVYCYPLYMGFFSFCGILLLALALGRWTKQASPTRHLLAGLGVLGVAWLVRAQSPEEFATGTLSIHLPRMKDMRLLPGTAPIEQLLANRFGLDRAVLRDSLEALAAVAIAFVILAGLGILGSLARKRRLNRKLQSWFAAPIAVGLAWTSLVHGNSFHTYDCGEDVISSYEAVGVHLKRSIPPGAMVYWAGGLSPVALLYVPEVEIFPAQSYVGYSYRIGGDPASLERFGLWNAELAREWLQRAEYALVEQREYTGWLAEALTSGGFEELQPSPRSVECRGDSWIHVYISRQ